MHFAFMCYFFWGRMKRLDVCGQAHRVLSSALCGRYRLASREQDGDNEKTLLDTPTVLL